MELDADLIGLQGVLISAQKTAKEFTKIKYATGNEMIINKIIKILQQYFTSKQFLKDNKIDHNYDKQLMKIAHFLIINTQFRNQHFLETEEVSHLINAVPPLSVCLLASVISKLDLTIHCCSIITAVPIEICIELLKEFEVDLKFYEKPNKMLKDTLLFLDKIIYLIPICKENKQAVELTDISSKMLTNISKIDLNNKHKLKGHTLLHLFQLLRKCSIYTFNLLKIINELIGLCIPIVKSITISIYCIWTEILYNEQSLQNVVAGEAYLVIEHLQKYEPAQELLSLLASIARKPMTLEEIISEADMDSIINKVNIQDENQKIWFEAFMKKDVLETEEARNCLNNWSQLCTRDHIYHLLNLAREEDKDGKELILKCAEQLDSMELAAIVSSSHLCESNSNKLDSGAVSDQLTILLNRLESDSQLQESFIKKILLLLLQNRSLVLSQLFKECLKNTFYTKCLSDVFTVISNPVIDGLVEEMFRDNFKNHPPTLRNFSNYSELLNVLIKMNYFRNGVVLFKLLYKQLQKSFEEQETLLYFLKILNSLSFERKPNQYALEMLDALIAVIEQFRCQFFTFDYLHQEITQEAINCFLKFHSLLACSCAAIAANGNFDRWKFKILLNKYYVVHFHSSIDMLHYIYPQFSIQNYAEAVTKLTKLLQICVPTEWVSITIQLESEFGYKDTLRLLTDILILLCQITETQMSADSSTPILNGLKFCLQQYGMVIKDVLQPKNSSLEDGILLAKNMCHLLKEVPDEVRKTEGLGLTGLLSDQSLRSLKQDKAFVVLLISIRDSTISKVLSERMLS